MMEAVWGSRDWDEDGDAPFKASGIITMEGVGMGESWNRSEPVGGGGSGGTGARAARDGLWGSAGVGRFAFPAG